jgi:hypothetical protein
VRLSQLEAYALTLAIEGAAAFLLAPYLGMKRRPAALAAIVGSALSHPVFWSAALGLTPLLGRLTVPLLEGVVVAGESLAYRGLATTSWRKALALSLLANLASYLTGLVLAELA